MNLHLLLLVFAFVLFAIAGFPYPEPYEPYRFRLVALGLAFWVGSILFT